MQHINSIEDLTENFTFTHSTQVLSSRLTSLYWRKLESTSRVNMTWSGLSKKSEEHTCILDMKSRHVFSYCTSKCTWVETDKQIHLTNSTITQKQQIADFKSYVKANLDKHP